MCLEASAEGKILNIPGHIPYLREPSVLDLVQEVSQRHCGANGALQSVPFDESKVVEPGVNLDFGCRSRMTGVSTPLLE
jgi:hypothetical protein